MRTSQEITAQKKLENTNFNTATINNTLKMSFPQSSGEIENALGDRYLKGEGGEVVDFKKAFSCYESAVQKGNPEALYNLAQCYYYGIGVQMDVGQAIMFFQQAFELRPDIKERKKYLQNKDVLDSKCFTSLPRLSDQSRDFLARLDLYTFSDMWARNPITTLLLLDTPEFLAKALDWIRGDSELGEIVAKNKLCQEIFSDTESFMAYSKDYIEMAIRILENFPDIAHLTPKDINLIPFEQLVCSLGLDHTGMQQQYLKKCENLDLASEPISIQDPIFNRNPIFKRMKKNAERYVSLTFSSLQSFCRSMMYGPSGYYNGRLKFKDEKNEGDFATSATDPLVKKVFAATFAYHLFNLWKLLEKKRPNQPFYYIECGAGNGDLCIEVLKIIKAMADKNIEWDAFFKSFHYLIVDKSSALHALQKENIQRAHSDCKNIKFFLGDATRLPKIKNLPKPVCAIGSNELLDMFVPYHFKRNMQGQLDIQVLLPIITKEVYEKYFAAELKISVTDLVKKSDDHKKRICAILDESDRLLPDEILLSEEDFLKIHASYIKQQLSKEKIFTFKDFYISSQYFKDADQFIKNNPNYFDTVSPNRSINASVEMVDFVESAQQMLCEGGMLLSVDYGDMDESNPRHIRTYCKGKQRNDTDFKQAPGFMDITIDVSFFLLYQLGKNRGMETEFYGMENQLLTQEAKQLFLENNILTKLDIDDFLKGSDLYNRMVCVQVKRGLALQAQALTSFSGEKQPIAYGTFFPRKKELFNKFSIQATLKKLKNRGVSCQWNPEQKEFIICNCTYDKYAIEQSLNKRGIYFKSAFDFESHKIILHISEKEKDKLHHWASLPMKSEDEKANNAEEDVDNELDIACSSLGAIQPTSPALGSDVNISQNVEKSFNKKLYQTRF